ncbi:TPA: single-stranded DNA-binding protein [Streptococcus suis]
MNNVSLMGNLVNDIELRQGASGVSIAKFRVAVNRQFKNANGEREVDFISCIAFKQTAELMARYCTKGSKIGLDGRIQTGSYENQSGQKVYTTDIVVNNVYFTGQSNQNNNGRATT